VNSEIVEATEDDVFYGSVPLFHTSGQLQIVLPAIYSGATAVLDRWFSASRFWERCVKHGATVIFLIGSMVNALLKQPVSRYEKEHKVRVAQTGGVGEREWLEFERRFGVRVYEGYGMTETCAVAAFNRPGETRVGSVGRILPHFEARVVDDEDNELPPGEVGELVIRPREPFVMMLEYYKKPEETVRAWRNLWFHTGDLVRMDEDGYIYFVGRKKDIIRRRGENVSPYYVESVINEYPGVVESAVVGVPSELGDEEIKACLVVRDKTGFDYLDFLRFCEERLPYYMVPRYVELVDELPKTPTQKIQRHVLKSRGVGKAFDAVKAGYKPKRPID
jgi:crotonobetaine/carnitine-CoA ligase